MFEKIEERVWLSAPVVYGDEMPYIQEALEKSVTSPDRFNVTSIENGLSSYVGCKKGLALSAGTSALHMAVKLAGIKAGDRVFCSDLTFAATVNPVVYEGGIPVFIDSEMDTWNMDPKALEKAFQKYPDTKAVIVVNLYGIPAKLDEIKSICDKYNAILIEDAAESLGAKYKGKQTGSFGKYSAISFNNNKIITSFGGGMLLSDDEEGIKRAASLAAQAKEPVLWYEHKETGYNYRMSNAVAGIARAQFNHLDDHIRCKNDIYFRYKQGFFGVENVHMNPYTNDMEPNFWLSCLYLKDSAKISALDLCKELDKYNIEARPIWKPMHLQPIFEGCEFISVEDGNSIGNHIFEHGICLPSDVRMSADIQNQVISIIKSLI